MRLIRLLEAGESGTPFGKFLGALMREFPPHEFVMVIGRLEHNLALFHRDGWTDGRKSEFLKHFTTLEKLEREYGFDGCAANIRAMIESINGAQGPFDPNRWLDEMTRTSRRFLYDTMAQLCYLEIPSAQRSYWENPHPFGDTVAAKFRDAEYDIEQASKCLALDRATSCVFHLMRALDYALQKLANKLKVTYDLRDSWDRILKNVNDKIEAMPAKPKAKLIKKENYRRVYGHLQAVRNAWRNPTMHPRKHYDTEEAEDVFCSTRGFMRDLTKVL